MAYSMDAFSFILMEKLLNYIYSLGRGEYIYKIYIQGVPKKRNDNFLTIKRSNVDGFFKMYILAASK